MASRPSSRHSRGEARALLVADDQRADPDGRIGVELGGKEADVMRRISIAARGIGAVLMACGSSSGGGSGTPADAGGDTTALDSGSSSGSGSGSSSGDDSGSGSDADSGSGSGSGSGSSERSGARGRRGVRPRTGGARQCRTQRAGACRQRRVAAPGDATGVTPAGGLVVGDAAVRLARRRAPRRLDGRCTDAAGRLRRRVGFSPAGPPRGRRPPAY